jgi:uncharacterized protein
VASASRQSGGRCRAVQSRLMYVNGQGVLQDYVQAHVWFNLAASGASDAKLRDPAVKARDEAAAAMTPAQIAKAQRLANEWTPK